MAIPGIGHIHTWKQHVPHQRDQANIEHPDLTQLRNLPG